MGLARSLAVALTGLDGQLVEVECDISAGLPGLSFTGRADPSVVESRDRLRAAILNSGVDWPNRKVTVALLPNGTCWLAVGQFCVSVVGVAATPSTGNFTGAAPSASSATSSSPGSGLPSLNVAGTCAVPSPLTNALPITSPLRSRLIGCPASRPGGSVISTRNGGGSPGLGMGNSL